MIKSMTGFGKAECECQNRKIVIEIKTLNSKQLDINARIPNGYREKEVEIRNLISNKLQRGKVDFQLSIDNTGDVSNFSINKDLARKYYRELKELSGDFEEKDFSDYLTVVMRLPDVLIPEKDEIGDQEWKLLFESIESAIEKVDEFRIEEGKSLEKDLKLRNENIVKLLSEIDPYEKERIKNLQQKIKKDLYEIANKEDIDKNRFEQEVVYYQDKLDITEEKVRLKKHCEYFLETMNEKGTQGKKLIFISQEMGQGDQYPWFQSQRIQYSKDRCEDEGRT